MTTKRDRIKQWIRDNHTPELASVLMQYHELGPTRFAAIVLARAAYMAGRRDERKNRPQRKKAC